MEQQSIELYHHAGIHVIEKQQSIELYHHAGIHVIEKQQSIELYHAGIHVIETAAKVVFAAVLGSIPVPVPGTRYVL